MHTSGSAPVTEQTPLLSSSHGHDISSTGDRPPKVSRRTSVSWTYHALTLAFVFLSLLLCLVTAIIFTAHAYVSPLLRADPSLLAQRSFVFEGPSHLSVLNYTSDGLWCELSGAAAIDGSRALGLSSNRFTDKLVGWAVRQVRSVTVSTSEVQVLSDDNVHLATLTLPDIILPLTTRTPPPLANITIQVLFQPARDVKEIMAFVAHSWKAGSAEVQIRAAKAILVGGSRTSSWRNRISFTTHNIQSAFELISACESNNYSLF
jgi:hypothetical protein